MVAVRLKAWQLPVLTLVFVITALAGLRYWRSQTLSPASLQNYLPAQVSTLYHVDVSSLAKAGVLSRMVGPPGRQDSDYVRFVEESGFDYQRDLRSLLVGVGGDTTYVLAKGVFDWRALRTYAESRNGVCRFSICRMAAYGRNRAISWGPLGEDTIALAFGPDPWGAATLTNGPRRGGEPIRESAPIWIKSSGSALRSAANLPDGMRMFARILEPAQQILVSIVPGAHADFDIRLAAECATPELAGQVASGLTESTVTLNSLLARENRRPNPADLSSVLAGGSFRAQSKRVTGSWPLSRAFVDTVLASQ